MLDARMTGLLLMAVSTLAFLGTTSQSLPSIAFFPALALFGLGAIKFMRSNRVALERAEQDVKRRLNPTIRENKHSHAHAERIAARRGQALSSLSGSEENAEQAARLASGATDSFPQPDEIELEDDEADFVVTTDVSFPVEVQSGDALADQLQKLNRLMSQGVLTEEEYAVAKAKLLD